MSTRNARSSGLSPTAITATQASRTFSDLLNRVQYRGERFLIERNGMPICEIIPAQPPPCTAADLAVLMRSLPLPDAEYAADVQDIISNQPPVPVSPWDEG